MKLMITFVALALIFSAAAICIVTLRTTPAAANSFDACVYKPEPIECPCTSCS